MDTLPTLRPTLLARLRIGDDRPAWEAFVEIYAPLVDQWARRRGLQEADAADVAQEVLLKTCLALRRNGFDPARGPFRGWFFTIARNAIFDRLSERRSRELAVGGSTARQALAETPETADDDDAWDADLRHRQFAWAADVVRKEVRPATWQAFWATTIDDRPGQDVAASLGITAAAVYLAKARVLKRIRELVADLTDEFASPPGDSP